MKNEKGFKSLEMRPELQQVLTPQIMQFLKLLQIPTLELEQIIRQELETNPILEEIEEEENPEEKTQEETNEEKEEKIDWEDFLQEGLDTGYWRLREKAESLEKVAVSIPTFEEYLRSQLHIRIETEEEIRIGEYLIDSLNESGYLPYSVEEIASELGSSKEKVEKVLYLIQTFDPLGVGARSLEECLLIQLRELQLENSLTTALIKKHLKELEEKRYSFLAQKLKVSEEEIRQAALVISSLVPRPGLSYSGEEIHYVCPDIIVEKEGDEYVVFLNDFNISQIRISPIYKEILKRTKTEGRKEYEYVRKKLAAARFLVKMLEQRRQTLTKIMRAIIVFQPEFFEKGASCLRPLTMKEVAKAVKMHESTVCRAIHNKYVQTSFGLFEMKVFFGGRTKTKTNVVSAEGIKTHLTDLISKEDPKSPLTDEQMVARLKEEGIMIARRTVAKYREELGILPAKLRQKQDKQLRCNDYNDKRPDYSDS
ncbi:MAG: RNA polymerase factor sigma-54 [Candidatus Edwardsbacteria bacterium]